MSSAQRTELSGSPITLEQEDPRVFDTVLTGGQYRPEWNTHGKVLRHQQPAP